MGGPVTFCQTIPRYQPIDWGIVSKHVPGEMLVKVRSATPRRVLEERGVTIVERFDFDPKTFPDFGGDLYRVSLPEGVSVQDGVELFGGEPSVEYAAPNKIFYLDEVESPPDDLNDKLYGLHNTGQDFGKEDADIDAPEAWALQTGRRDGPIVAVLDTGIDLNHPDLVNNLWRNPAEVVDGKDNDGNGIIDDLHGYDAVDNDGVPQESTSHGTHVAGTIAAEGNNGQGVVGVNWQAQLMPIRIFDEQEKTSSDIIIRGLIYAGKMGARITSNSWGGTGEKNLAIEDAFRNVDALHIAAAGNKRSNNDKEPHYPSGYDLPNMIAVAATDRKDRLAGFSNWGEESVDIAAPGADIYSTLPRGRYGTKSGTSMATPHVSGAAALLLCEFPQLSNAEVKERLLSRSDPIDSLKGKVAHGRLNVGQALETDTVPPANPGDFGPRQVVADKITLGWVAPGDDQMQGRARTYELRMSDQPITKENFLEAEPLEPPTPAEAGSEQQLEISVLPWIEERQRFFALRALDNLNNASELVTAEARVPAVEAVFADDFDSEESAWSAQGTWARVPEPGRGMVWTDSPDGNTEPGADFCLISPSISLEGRSGCQLVFETRHSLERWRDQVHVDVSADGTNWRTLDILHDEQTEWTGMTFALSEFDGQTVQLRFRSKPNSSNPTDGVYLDRLVVTAGTPT